MASVACSKSAQIITRTEVVGAGGVVAAAREATVRAAVHALEQGGNAVDAAVSAALVAGVIEPMETTLAGSGFLLVGLPTGEVSSVEFGPRAPRAAAPDMFTIDRTRDIDRGLGISVVVGDENVQGIRAAGVPMTLAGLAAAHERFGMLPWSALCRPAIQAAADGFSASPYLALEVLANIEAIRLDEGARRLFLPGGSPPSIAHLGQASLGTSCLVRQGALARSLERIAAEGVGAFYGGGVGRLLLETHRDLGGLLSHEDLVGAKAVVVPPHSLDFRDYQVHAPRAPCGGVTELQILQLWLALFPDKAPDRNEMEHVSMLAQASWHAFADRYHWLGDPDFVSVPTSGLLSDGYARKVAGLIRSGEAPPRSLGTGQAPWNYFSREAAHDPWTYEASGAARGAPWRPAGATEPPSGTTHISVTDRNGMSVSLTHTAANHCGAKVVCPRTGFLLDATMGWFNALPGAANSIAGGKRPLANMGPVLLSRAGKPYAALGAPGGRRIIDAVVQVILNLVEHGMSPAEALLAPRIDTSGNGLLMSERLQSMAPELETLFGPVGIVGEQHQGYGYELARPNLSLFRDGRAYAAADPFSEAYAWALN
ncbi:gamma-glutamyltransferase [uncultured Castellaniella sp.]|uniref:gamma-glutamyltransferase family protein n=1 Tax=uncultured Castellaniella sp. TaxID=647907 RepID=UPI00260C39B8|nr:gamma-glutamyltransferase [uncultured Castellaniella sp.]